MAHRPLCLARVALLPCNGAGAGASSPRGCSGWTRTRRPAGRDVRRSRHDDGRPGSTAQGDRHGAGCSRRPATPTSTLASRSAWRAEAWCTAAGRASSATDLEEMVRRMILEGLGVAKHHETQSESMWHLFRMSEYKAPNSDEKVTGYITHQNTNWLSIVCQNEVNRNEMQTRDGEWGLVKPSPTSLIVNVGNTLSNTNTVNA
uniref:Isopenicillin N synthase-like Fe(2+) 2OG dioxygenase domain-containing protein n=1 Tax=Oryza brachyantha TaxID=4533 RepID=J3MRM7_ORYBR